MAEKGFNPAAEFLLSMNWINLFEPTGDPDNYRCKGCDEKVSRHEREKHYNRHRGIRKRSETMRQERIKRERRERLAKINTRKGVMKATVPGTSDVLRPSEGNLDSMP